MGLRNIVSSFLLLIFGVSLIISLLFVFDSITFALPTIQKPIPLTQYELFPKGLHLLDLYNFQYVINNDLCSDETDIKGIIIVTSHAGDIEARSSMRRAYPSNLLKTLGLRRIFLLAISNPNDVRYNSISQGALQDENLRYSDLVQGNFKEAYRNLTYKHVMGLQWVTRYCSQAKFVIKMDDDIIVNFYRIFHIIESSLKERNNSFLMGYVLKGTLPVREPMNKWFVTKSEYSDSVYPPFLSGWMYITTPRVAKTLVEISKSIKYFWIDDTYVTGLLAHKAGIFHIDIHQYFTLYPEFLECCIRDKEYICDYIVGPSNGDPSLVIHFQMHADNCQENQCIHRSHEKALNRTCVAPKRTAVLRHGHGEVNPIQLF
ncbi:hypothetical protein L9F63_023306 [Diploptera punctata]|uniref:Hexosyltransferase n=1 Tax=Diploptera punctata TaxID=6984 RepID=A0AAD8E8T3_DIPPU|nr:hypothetical protein L9F63_023306 [Diploptera punctata]